MDLALTRRDLYRFMTAYSGRSLREVLGGRDRFWRRVHNRATRLYRQEARKAERRPAHDGATAFGPLGR
jgi:hypothetical protein